MAAFNLIIHLQFKSALTLAVGETIVSISTTVTVGTAVVGLARALSTSHLAHKALRSVHVTVARFTTWVTVVTQVTLVAVEARVLGSALAPAGALLAFSSGVCRVTPAT